MSKKRIMGVAMQDKLRTLTRQNSLKCSPKSSLARLSRPASVAAQQVRSGCPGRTVE